MERKRARKQQKKNKKIVFTIVGILGVGVIAGGSYFGYQHVQKKKKEEALNLFVDNLEKKEFNKLVTAFSADSFRQVGMTKEEVIDKYSAIFNSIGLSKIDGTIDSLNKDDFSVNVKMDTPFGSLKDLHYKGEFVKEGSDYKLSWNYSFIFPDMKEGDKVFMSHEMPKRGTIYDINNNPLATETQYPQYGIVPKELGEGDTKTENLKKISEELDISVDDINQSLSQGWVKEDSFVPLKVLSGEKSTAETTINGLQVQGINKRYYPLKEAAAHLIGYTGSVTAEEIEKDGSLSGFDSVGKTGLEAQLDKELRGSLGGKIEIVDKEGAHKKTLIQSKVKDGEDVYLTIDGNVQTEAYKALNNLPGSTVVTEPKKGALKAVVSSPSYDPNAFVLGMSGKEYDAISKDPNNPLLARYSVGYAPGSTFKTITAAIGIDEKVTTPDKQHTIDGLKWQKDTSWGDYFVTRVSDVSPVTMEDALVYSDNIYFSMESLEMGAKNYLTGLKKFPFGEKMNVGIPMTPAQISNDDNKIDSNILLADTSYGQGQLLINPIQQAVMYSAFPNQGSVVMPVIKKDDKAKVMKDVVSNHAAQLVTQALIQTVENPNGTAHVLATGSNNIAAKTGTAEIKEKQDTKGQENSFILAYDSVEGNYLVVSMLENAKDTSAVAQNKEFIQSLH